MGTKPVLLVPQSKAFRLSTMVNALGQPIDGKGPVNAKMTDKIEKVAPGVIARKSVENLLVIKEDEAYCQPCVSPVWDTALVAHTLLEVGGSVAEAEAVDAKQPEPQAEPLAA